MFFLFVEGNKDTYEFKGSVPTTILLGDAEVRSVSLWLKFLSQSQRLSIQQKIPLYERTCTFPDTVFDTTPVTLITIEATGYTPNA